MTPAARTMNKIIPDLNWLWEETMGDPSIRIAIMDGRVNRGHPALATAKLEILTTFTGMPSGSRNPYSNHGTHVASVILGQHDSKIKGIAPFCTGLSVPIFFDDADGNISPCSQLDLARGVYLAAEAGTHIINISGGEFNASGKAHPLLEKALAYCQEKNILVVAAAGNDGCSCLHIPGAIPSVLAVGGMDEKGHILKFSNWGAAYWEKGILAPGVDIPGAAGEKGIALNSGTSYAAAIVSGIAALLLSAQKKWGMHPNPTGVREALLESADGCGHRSSVSCQKLLKGRLNINGAFSFTLHKKSITMQALDQNILPTSFQEGQVLNEVGEIADGITASCITPEIGQPGSLPEPSSGERVAASSPKVKASGCGCGGSEGSCSCSSKKATGSDVPRVYALGTLGYDLASEARRDSIAQHMDGNPSDPVQWLEYLENNPWDAAAAIWTLSLDATPIYAIQPYGGFAAEGYSRLRGFLSSQLKKDAERISVPGHIMGQIQLMSGQVVPVIVPDLRCMYNWSTAALATNVLGDPPADNSKSTDRQAYEERRSAITNFLERVYHELRNLGALPQDRAINYAATNALNTVQIFAGALKDNMQLDTIQVEQSTVCRMGSDCWDVVLCFFDPEKQLVRARKCYRFTVDVSDVCPVMVGAVREWFVR